MSQSAKRVYKIQLDSTGRSFLIYDATKVFQYVVEESTLVELLTEALKMRPLTKTYAELRVMNDTIIVERQLKEDEYPWW